MAKLKREISVPAGDVRLLLVAADVGARLLDQLLHHPRRDVAAVARDRRS